MNISRTYYLFSAGRLRRKDNTLAFEFDEGRRIIPVEDIDHLYCFAPLDFNSKVLGIPSTATGVHASIRLLRLLRR